MSFVAINKSSSKRAERFSTFLNFYRAYGCCGIAVVIVVYVSIKILTIVTGNVLIDVVIPINNS